VFLSLFFVVEEVELGLDCSVGPGSKFPFFLFVESPGDKYVPCPE